MNQLTPNAKVMVKLNDHHYDERLYLGEQDNWVQVFDPKTFNVSWHYKSLVHPIIDLTNEEIKRKAK